MMIKKIKCVIGLIILLAVAIVVTLVIIRKQNQEIFAELASFVGSADRGSVRVHRIVLKTNGTLIHCVGDSYDHRDIRRNIMRTVHESTTITLSEEDFQAISEMIRNVLEDYPEGGWIVTGMTEIFLLYDDYVYGTRYAIDVTMELNRLMAPYRN